MLSGGADSGSSFLSMSPTVSPPAITQSRACHEHEVLQGLFRDLDGKTVIFIWIWMGVGWAFHGLVLYYSILQDFLCSLFDNQSRWIAGLSLKGRREGYKARRFTPES